MLRVIELRARRDRRQPQQQFLQRIAGDEAEKVNEPARLLVAIGILPQVAQIDAEPAAGAGRDCR